MINVAVVVNDGEVAVISVYTVAVINDTAVAICQCYCSCNYLCYLCYAVAVDYVAAMPVINVSAFALIGSTIGSVGREPDS